MRNMTSMITALVMRLARLWTEHPVGGVQVFSEPQWCGLNHRGGLTATFAAIIVVVAAIPQCESAQTPFSESTQTPTSQTSLPGTQAPLSEPEVVVRELIEAMQANDAERIRSLFDANASQAYGDGGAKSGEEFFRWLDSDIIERQGRVENAQLAVNGNEVVVTGQYQSIGYTSPANFLLTVENGRITSWRMRY